MQLGRKLEKNFYKIVIRGLRNHDVYKISQMTLDEKEIQVWILQWRELIDWIKHNWEAMSLLEKNYVKKFMHEDDRMRSAAGKILTRKLLSHYMIIPEKQIEILRGEFGKPFLNTSNPSKLHFSVSHSEEIVLVAIAKERLLGIDVEKMHSIPDYLSLSRNFFTRNEWINIDKVRDEMLFYYYWTAKEAYVKAIGSGLHRELNSFEINENGIIDSMEDSKKWNRRTIDVSEGYIANIVYELTRREKM